MLKMITAVAVVTLSLAACGGGGGDGGSTAPAAKTMKLSLYGQPFTSSQAVSHAQVVANAAASSSDAVATVQTLQDALTARGVPSTVTAQVMDGTTLHQIVMGENNGLPPTPDQFKTDPSGYLVVNFQLDDMVTRADDPAQKSAVQQFIQDLTVFSQRASVSGKLVYAVVPIQTCDLPSGFSGSDALNYAITQAASKTLLNKIGAIPFGFGWDSAGHVINTADTAHLGADCRTPDAYLLNMRTNAIADYIAALYKETAAPAGAASGASATGT
ncbi:hypothetical protein J2794_003612 [Paraburkholderia terricola]|uniref:hypothetical protein n=1 Tax=Paraburkholderia terricola TaxID=169427 RepID=UPI0028583DA4|nr:hypothetical protein [Paraburkholderia terricola]MDR6447496.1 hypothetical protein [Paraburkholderia terricola]